MGKLPPYRTTIASAVTGALLALFPVIAMGFEARLTLPPEAEDLRRQLEGSSLVFSAQRNEVEDAHDIVSSARAEYRRLLSVLYGHGYFGPKIQVLVDGREAANLPTFETIHQVNVVELRVTPGRRFQFGDANLGPLAPDAEITEQFQTGEVATTGVITQAARQGVEGWRDDGHAKANVSDQSIVADHKDATLNVDIDLEPGPKLTFGALHLSGKTRITEERLQEIIALPVGETFSPDELDRIGRRLRRTGVFRSVSISEAERIGANDTLDILVQVEDDKPRRITFGAELESRDGLSISASWLHRNLFGGGERFLIDAEVSGIGAQTGGTDLRLNTELTRPATFQADTDLSFGLDFEVIDDPLYEMDRLGINAFLTRVVSPSLTASAGILAEISQSTDDYGDRDFQVLGIPVRATWDRRDDQLNSTSGYFLSGTVMPYAAFGDGAPGAYVLADSRVYRRLGEGRVVAAARLQLGTILGPSIAETPPNMLFLSGGGGTVRGQPYQSNFVTVNGRDSGGLSFIGVSGELRIKTTETISTVAFYDAGFVGETSNFAGSGNWHAGAGLGVRYHTSFGPIRVDLGFPVSGDTSGGTQLYVGIGQAF